MLPLRLLQRAALRSAKHSSSLSSQAATLESVGAFTTSFSRSAHSQYPSNQTQYSHPSSQQSPKQNIHTNFYKTHGRAFFKSLTLAFLSYQIFYWAWLTLEMETMKDGKTREIKAVEEEARLLGSGQGTHLVEGKRLLDEPVGVREEGR